MSPLNNNNQTDLQDSIIDIHNAHAVAQFVEHFFNDHGLSSSASRTRIEKLLLHLPEKIIIQRDVTSWIRKNWDKKFHNF